MREELLLVVSTWPTAESAQGAGRTVVEEQLAACANILPGIESIFRWEGRVDTASEVIVMLKTTPAAYPALERRLRELHPYEVPEILAFSAKRGLPAYCDWVLSSCASNGTGEKGN